MQTITIKALRLIDPHRAPPHIRRATPTFVSPFVKPGECTICDVRYTPLIYPLRSLVVAQHYHQEQGGGIYHYHVPLAKPVWPPASFLLTVTPRQCGYPWESWNCTAPEVETHDLIVYCHMCGRRSMPNERAEFRLWIGVNSPSRGTSLVPTHTTCPPMEGYTLSQWGLLVRNGSPMFYRHHDG